MRNFKDEENQHASKQRKYIMYKGKKIKVASVLVIINSDNRNTYLTGNQEG